MKTIEVSDQCHEALSTIAERCGTASASAHIENLPEVRAEYRNRREQKLLQLLDENDFSRKDLRERFLICIYLIYKTVPEAFQTLEGFTKPEGQAVFISRSKEKILKTSKSIPTST